MQTLTPMTVDRRALHRIPELGDELPKTMDYVQDVLGIKALPEVNTVVYYHKWSINACVFFKQEKSLCVNRYH